MRDRARWAALVALAAGLRLWALGFGLPSWLHPDEYSSVLFPLNFFGGDLNPHFFTYPTLHYYLLGLVYGGYFLLQKIAGAGLSLEQFLALHYFWDQAELMYLARLQSALFGVGTIVWTWALATRVYGRRAAWPAAALLAVCSLHVRQSHLAGVDVELCFWFVGAVWAAVRLTEREAPLAYALAGALVGLAATTKYPGALAGTAVAVAHLTAGRPLWDRKLWGAGGMALACFVLGSPYVVLDWHTFSQGFLSQVGHLEAGHGQDLGLGWWYHLKISLPIGLGWLGMFLAATGAVLALKERRPAELTVMAAVLAFYLVMGSGHTVFVRYVLPLLPLLAVLAAGVLARTPKDQHLALALVLVCAQPLYTSWRTLQLLTTPDTRVQARAWIEEQVPEGAAIGNFGGWAGDVKVRTFEGLWLQIFYFQASIGQEAMQRAILFLESQPRREPFYTYGIQRTNIEAAAGSIEEIERLEPEFVVLHRHPLEYSRIDSTFALELGEIAELQTRFVPPGLEQETPQYDPLDAFYVPLSEFGVLAQPGPEVEIWRVKEVPRSQGGRLAVRSLFARGYATGAAMFARGSEELAIKLAIRALELDPECSEAYFVLAFLHQQAGRREEAVTLYDKCLQLQPENATSYHNLAVLYQELGQPDQVEQLLREALRLAPWKRSSYATLAQCYQRQHRPAPVLEIYTQQLEHFPDGGFAYEALGGFWETGGQLERAAEIYRRGLERAARHEPLYLRLAQLYLRKARPQQAAAICEQWLRLKPGQAEAHRLLAYACRSLGQTAKARTHASEALHLAPSTDPELAQWLAGQ